MLATLYLSLLIGLYLASLIGVFFLSDSAVLLGALAFLLMFIVGVVQQGFQRRPIRLKLLWKFVFPCFAALFLTTLMLSWSLGAPRMQNRPVFAQRDHYYFTRGGEVSRARFVATGVCFYLAWHVFAVAFAAEHWAALKTKTVQK
jgi:hypothetical protein